MILKKVIFFILLTLCSIVSYADTDDLDKMIAGEDQKVWTFDAHLTKPLLGAKCDESAKIVFRKKDYLASIHQCIVKRLKLSNEKNEKELKYNWELMPQDDKTSSDAKSFLLKLHSEDNKINQFKILFSNDIEDSKIEKIKVTTIPDDFDAPRYNLYFRSNTQ